MSPCAGHSCSDGSVLSGTRIWSRNSPEAEGVTLKQRGHSVSVTLGEAGLETRRKGPGGWPLFWPPSSWAGPCSGTGTKLSQEREVAPPSHEGHLEARWGSPGKDSRADLPEPLRAATSGQLIGYPCCTLSPQQSHFCHGGGI